MSTSHQHSLEAFFGRSPLSSVHTDDETYRGRTAVSPEEQIIQQRGRLRSSPRRKALMSNSPRLKVTEMVDMISDSPNDKSGWTPLRKKSQVDGIKRKLQLEETINRVEADSDAQSDSTERLPKNKRKYSKTNKSEPPNLHKRLSALSSEQLTTIIETLVGHHPELEEEISIPSPDISSLIENLESLKSNIYKSFPNSRWGSNRDAFCYRRVKTHLDSFTKSCIDQGKQLESLESWPALLNYILKAWEIVEELPLWDNPDHNKSRTRCFKTLGVQCKRCINHDHLTQPEYRKLLTRLKEAVQINENILPCVELVQKKIS